MKNRTKTIITNLIILIFIFNILSTRPVNADQYTNQCNIYSEPNQVTLTLQYGETPVKEFKIINNNNYTIKGELIEVNPTCAFCSGIKILGNKNITIPEYSNITIRVKINTHIMDQEEKTHSKIYFQSENYTNMNDDCRKTLININIQLEGHNICTIVYIIIIIAVILIIILLFIILKRKK